MSRIELDKQTRDEMASRLATRLGENRDTAPTLDMRGLFKGVLGEHLGVDRAALDTLVFPNSADVRAVAGLV